MSQLLKIDELVISDHYYLAITDQCYYFMEYTAGAGYSASIANDLITNFKKSLAYKEHNSWKYKLWAIKRVADIFGQSLPNFIDLSTTTLVPIPPSKAKNNPLHDGRMLQTLEKFSTIRNADVRELLLLNEDMEAVHETIHRLTPHELEQYISLNPEETDNLKDNIILFDDVLTTGAHFVACKNKILAAYPDKNVQGIFIARRAIPATENDFDEIWA